MLHCIHVFCDVVGNTPRSDPSAHKCVVLVLPRHSIHQNVIAYREIPQRLAEATAHTVVTTIGVDAMQQPCQELLLGVHQRNHQLLRPVVVDCAKLKPSLSTSMRAVEAVRGSRLIMTWSRIFCSRFRHGVFNAHCTTASTTTHPLNGISPSLSIGFAPLIISGIIPSVGLLVHELLATEKRYSTLSAKTVMFSLTHTWLAAQT